MIFFVLVSKLSESALLVYVNIFTQSYADVLKSCNVHCIGTMKEEWLLEDILLYTCRHLFNRLTWTYASVLDDMVAMSGKEFLVCLFSPVLLAQKKLQLSIV